MGVVGRQWLVVAVTTISAVLVALAASLLQPTRYTSTTEVLVPYHLPAGDDLAQQVLAQRSFDPNRAMQDEARIAASMPVLNEVRQRAGQSSSVSAKATKDADVLVISVWADSPELSQTGARVAADVYLHKHNDLIPKNTPPAEVLQPATLPAGPSEPAITRNLLLALLAGAALGVVLGYALDSHRRG